MSKIILTENSLREMIQESVKSILREYTRDYGIPVKNRKLYSLLHKEGIDGITLVKAYGYFFIQPETDEMMYFMNDLDDTSIYVNSFNQLTVEEWVETIKNLLNQR